MNVARLLDPGLSATFQDSGRPGWRRFGVPASGAMDHHSAIWANRLLNNPDHVPVIEFLLQGAEIEILQDCWMAITGAESNGPIPTGTATLFFKGDRIRFPRNLHGVWIYLAVAGGWQTKSWLGSASVYARALMGKPLGKEQKLVSMPNNLSPFPAAVMSRRLKPEELTKGASDNVFFLDKGPQFQDFPERSQTCLVESEWQVSTHSDRTGYRLEGPSLESGPEITSEPVLPGSFQIPGNGQPIVTMPDGPTVGGYPKIAYLEPKQRWQLAQCAPGTKIKFQWK
ncbi:MAG: biotin-dependent carboxyltransferase family protein [Verrucomicrobiota bacterium]